MKLRGLAFTLALSAGMSGAQALADDEQVPRLDHAFVIVLENHNSFTSFGSIGILDNPQAPNIQALAQTFNVAPNYHGVWHPSLPNYIAMIAGASTCRRWPASWSRRARTGERICRISRKRAQPSPIGLATAIPASCTR